MLDLKGSGRKRSLQMMGTPTQRSITWTGLILTMKAVPIFEYLLTCYVDQTFGLTCFA